MKAKIKNFLRKFFDSLLQASSVPHRFAIANQNLQSLESQIRLQSDCILYLKSSTRKKPRLLFLVQSYDHLQWSSLLSKLSTSSEFDTQALLIPTVQPGQTSRFSYCWRSKALLQKHGIPVTIAPCPETAGEDSTHPLVFWADYVFVQTPYDSQRAKSYSSDLISAASRIVYIPYGYTIVHIPEYQYGNPFLQNCFRYYLESEDHGEICSHYNPSIRSKTRIVGHPKLELFPVLKETEPTPLKVLWNPRWALHDPHCTFEWTLDFMLNYFKSHPDADLIFRPHPLMPAEIAKRKVFATKIKELEALPNVRFDSEATYMKAFEESSLLVSDASSLLAEYLPTGKPIIYTHNGKIGLNSHGEKLMAHFLVANDEKSLQQIISSKEVHRNEALLAKRKFFIDPIIKTTPPSEKILQDLVNHARSTLELEEGPI
jgi:hypothetical protein